MAIRIRRKLTGLFVGAALAMAPVASSAETLADALIGAYKHSGLLEQQRALLRAADEDVAQSLAALRPVLSYTAQVRASRSSQSLLRDEWDTNASVGITASLVLYDFYASAYGTQVQKELVLATREALVAAEQSVLLGATQSYMEVRRQSAFVDLRRSNVRVIGEELRAAQDRFDVGEVTRTDVALAEARLASARSQLAGAQGNLAQAKEQFYRAVGRAPGALAAPTNPPALARDEAAAKRYAVKYHPSVKEAQRNVTAAEFRIAEARAGTKPTLQLQGQLTLNDEWETDESVTLQLSGPIYSGGQIASLIRQQSARRDAQRAALHLTTHEIRESVGNAYSSLTTAIASREAFARQVRASRIAFRGVREEATLGSRTTLDVLDAEQELLDAQTNLISAQIDEINARYSILASMGLMTAEHLKLGIRTYDPTAYYDLVKNAPASHSKQGKQLDRVLKAIGKQ
ncbi:TolC family outer membrane protein [Algirhabdus cladophorae]|uniref:TolC family outer membrane protein n=1 Tax=Algirhabdus cladophorae TaxID=3377108 RepID=UPI003B84B4BF